MELLQIKPILNLCVITLTIMIFPVIESTVAAEVNVEKKMSKKLPNLKQWTGHGRLSLTVKSEEALLLNAFIEQTPKTILASNNACKGVTLKTEEKTIFSLFECESGEIVLCPGGENNCFNKNLGATHATSQGWERKGNLTHSQYKVAFSGEQLIYQILKKKCLIPYPHGCFLYGPGWKNHKTYQFSLDRK